MMGEFDPTVEGVLPDHEIRQAIASGFVKGVVESDEAVQPASLDLRLGPVAYRLRSSFLPRHGEPIAERLQDLAMGELDLASGAVLEVNRPYLIPLQEALSLPHWMAARANPKSSTGRIDVLTRLITDGNGQFDDVPFGYTGNLYVELVANTFTVKVHEGLRLNQLRLSVGSPRLGDAAIREAHREQPLLYHRGAPVASEALARSDGLFVSLDLEAPPPQLVGFRAKRNSKLLDLSAIDGHDPEDYWEPVRIERRNEVVLEPSAFYLLLSAESICIPPDFAGEMIAYDPTSGELRTHYAGFFDPGFGWDEFNLPGSQAALEVRVHDVPFMVQDRQRVCKIAFDRLRSRPERAYGQAIGSHYQGQQSTLSKYFRRPLPESQLRLDVGG